MSFNSSVSYRILVSGVSVCLLLGCENTSDVVHSPANIPPTSELTSAPPEGSETSYKIRISWSGSDPDGYVTRYEYAIDPPDDFTEEEITSGGPGIITELVPGADGDPDITRISKEIDGKTVFFEWIHTTAFSKRFRFSTPDLETKNDTPTHPGRFLGMHAIYVRAVDDDNLVSTPDHVAFTATNLAPTSTITSPRPFADILNLGLELHVDWTGEDLDGIRTRKPIGYFYKLLRLDTLDPPIPVLFARPSHLMESGDDWIYQSADSPLPPLSLAEQAQFIFGVRAVDETGAVEPFLDQGRNVIKFQALKSGGLPILWVAAEGIGAHTARGLDNPVQLLFTTNADLICSISCNTERYGGLCDTWRWGVDLIDLDQPEGWSAWTTNPILPPIRFEHPGIHVLYIEARDHIGNISRVTLVLDVIELTFDRDVLFVDDSFDDTFPTDGERDNFWRNRFEDYSDPEVQFFEFHAHSDSDQSLLPQLPTIEELGRYKLLIWDVKGTGYHSFTALMSVAQIRPILRLYLRSGGMLWLSGDSSMISFSSNWQWNYWYPKEFRLGSFVWEYLKLQNTIIDSERQQGTIKNLLAEVHPSPADTPVFSTMAIDPEKIPLADRGFPGIRYTESVMDPIVFEEGFRGTFEPLYTYRAVSPVSRFEDKLTALRWHDPDPDREHGRIQWFGFPMYFFFDDQAQDTFNKSMDWFREEVPN